MHEVVIVQVARHFHPRQMQLLVIGGTRQRRQDEEFEQIDRELALDDADVTLDRGRCIARKAQDVPRVCQRAHAMPCLQHRTVFGDLVLAFPRLLQRIRVDTFEADEHPIDPCAACLSDEPADLVRHRVHLRDDVDAQAFPLPAS